MTEVPFYSPEPDIFTKVERLNKLGEVVVANPKTFDMGYWFEVLSPDEPYDSTETLRSIGMAGEVLDLEIDSEGFVLVDKQSCGTRACLAGWAVSLWGHELSPYERKNWTVSDAAEKLLGLGSCEANDLFDSGAHDNDPMVAAQACKELADEAMTEWIAGE